MHTLSRQAPADLDGIVGWLLDTGSGAGAAERLLDAVLDAADRLARQPQLGRHRPELLPAPYRFWSLPRHKLLLVYRPERQPIRIVRVLNTAQDLPPLLAGLRDPDEPS